MQSFDRLPELRHFGVAGDQIRPQPGQPDPAVMELRGQVQQIRQEMQELKNMLRQLMERQQQR